MCYIPIHEAKETQKPPYNKCWRAIREKVMMTLQATVKRVVSEEERGTGERKWCPCGMTGRKKCWKIIPNKKRYSFHSTLW